MATHPGTDDTGWMRRPDPLHWLGYAFGAGLPDRNREWVLHDVTAPSWWVRHLLRATVQLIPLLVILYLVVPGPSWVRLMGALAGALIGYFYSVAYMHESAETRVAKAGYPVGTAASTREERGAEARLEAQERYNAQWRDTG